MDNKPYEKIITDFFQIFSKSVTNTLSKTLDEDTCNKIEFAMKSTSSISDAESLKKNNLIYKIEYAIGTNQGLLVALIPEELIASISDVLTGGTGQGAYKGSLSEIETNSILGILEKVCKNIETEFNKHYEYGLVFGSSPVILLKEMPDYAIQSDNAFFDLVVNNSLSLMDGLEFAIDLLFHSNVLKNMVSDFGTSGDGTMSKKHSNLSMNIDMLGDIQINITAELGRARVPIKYALELVRGSLVELETLCDSDIKIFANGVEFAQAQIVAVQDNFGLKITKIASREERLEKI